MKLDKMAIAKAVDAARLAIYGQQVEPLDRADAPQGIHTLAHNLLFQGYLIFTTVYADAPISGADMVRRLLDTWEAARLAKKQTRQGG